MHAARPLHTPDCAYASRARVGRLPTSARLWTPASRCGCPTSRPALQDSAEWVGRTVGTKKYRPPEMRDSRPATSAIDVFCFGLMVEKLLRQVGLLSRLAVAYGGCRSPGLRCMLAVRKRRTGDGGLR